MICASPDAKETEVAAAFAANALAGAPEMVKADGAIKIQGEEFAIVIDRADGLIQSLKHGEASVPLVGPMPHIYKFLEFIKIGINPDIGNTPSHVAKIAIYNSPLLEAWKFKDLRIEKKDNVVVVNVTGQFDSFDVAL